MYYFAYGSNLNHKQMNCRCPNNKYITRVYLDNYKFVYDGYSKKREGAVANVLESADSVVLGGLYEISKSDLENLDKCEGYPNIYNKKELKVEDDHRNIYKTITYLRIGEKIGIPSSEYRKIIMDGAKDCSLPDNYVKNNLI